MTLRIVLKEGEARTVTFTGTARVRFREGRRRGEIVLLIEADGKAILEIGRDSEESVSLED